MRLTVLFAALTVLAGGCGRTDPAPAAVQPVPTLDPDGQRFDPPAERSEIPPGAWMCDMGTVHYASGDQHDGTCPVCGMTLVQKPPADQ